MKTEKPKRPVHWTPAMAVMSAMLEKHARAEALKTGRLRRDRAPKEKKRVSIRGFIAEKESRRE
jgi:hypothetical protein